MKTRYIAFSIVIVSLVFAMMFLNKTVEKPMTLILGCSIGIIFLSFVFGNLTGSGTCSTPDGELKKGEVFEVVDIVPFGGAKIVVALKYPFVEDTEHTNVLILRFPGEGSNLRKGYRYIWSGLVAGPVIKD